MPRDHDLKRRLELAGLHVIEVDGWTTRGKDSLNAVGSVHHHTGGGVGRVAPSLGICINGRSDLPGPLCNVFGARTEDNSVYLVAAGTANHAGKGGWKGHTGNSSVYGLEEEHSGGPNEPVSELRIDRMARVHAAFAFGQFEADQVCQHREWAPGRKPDFIAKFIDADDFRNRVATHLERMKNPQSDLTEEEMEEILKTIHAVGDSLAAQIQAIGKVAEVNNRLLSDIHPDADASAKATAEIKARIEELKVGDGSSADEILDAMAARLDGK